MKTLKSSRALAHWSKFRRWITLLFRALCQWDASWLMGWRCSIKSRYWTHSVQFCVEMLDKFCHSATGRKTKCASPNFPGPLDVFLTLWWFCCQGLWPHFFPLERVGAVRYCRAFNTSTFLGNFPHWHIIVPSNTYVCQLNQLHITDVEDRAARFFTKYLPKFRWDVASRNLVWSRFKLIHMLVDFLHVRFILPNCVLPCILRSISTSIFEVLCQLFSEAISTRLTSLVPFHVLPSLHKPIAFQRKLTSGRKVFRTMLDLFFFKNYSEDAISWQKIEGRSQMTL